MIRLWPWIAIAAGLAACKDKPERRTPHEPAAEAPAESQAPPEPTLRAADAEGRCENRTPGAPYEAIYFYPSRRELFVPSKQGAAFRLPLRMRGATGDSVEFDYRWSSNEDGSEATTHPAAVTARDGGRLSFEFETLKPTVCVRAAHDAFYAALPTLGIPAGSFRNAEHDDVIEIPVEGQKILSIDEGKSSVAHYRVVRASDDGVRLYVSNQAPSDTRPTVWVEWTVGAAGDVLSIDYMGKFTRTYTREP